MQRLLSRVPARWPGWTKSRRALLVEVRIAWIDPEADCDAFRNADD
jgi:hypothetical protein